MDVSSHQPRDLSALIAQYNIEHVIVKLYQPREKIDNTPNAQDWSRWQIDSARANGCSVGGYSWLYKAWVAGQQIREVIALADDCGLLLPRLDIDFEPYTDRTMPTITQLWHAVNECRRLNVVPRIYCAEWVLDEYGIDLAEFANAGVPLWAMQNDGIPDPDVFTPFGGYTRCEAKQWQTYPIDLDIIRREALAP